MWSVSQQIPACLLNGYRFGQVAGLIHIGTSQHSHVISKQLDWQRVDDRGSKGLNIGHFQGPGNAIVQFLDSLFGRDQQYPRSARRK